MYGCIRTDKMSDNRMRENFTLEDFIHIGRHVRLLYTISVYNRYFVTFYWKFNNVIMTDCLRFSTDWQQFSWMFLV